MAGTLSLKETQIVSTAQTQGNEMKSKKTETKSYADYNLFGPKTQNKRYRFFYRCPCDPNIAIKFQFEFQRLVLFLIHSVFDSEAPS